MSNSIRAVHIDRKKQGEGSHQPGHAYKRDFNHSPKGRMAIRMGRGKGSRSKTARS
jgi:hypothetical protein